MQFLNDEEAFSLSCLAEPDISAPVISKPFPFLKLPREIRDSIYNYALIRPNTGRTVSPTHICYVDHKASAMSSRVYWGTEKATRLFRVNRQVSHEALAIFYSSFPFYFPQWVDVGLVKATLRDTLSARARSLISSIGFMIILTNTSGPFTHSEDEKRRQALEAVVKLLPNVRRVELTLSFVGREVPDYQVKEVVTRAIRITSPLKGIAGLVLRGASNGVAQRKRIIGEVREALNCL